MKTVYVAGNSDVVGDARAFELIDEVIKYWEGGKGMSGEGVRIMECLREVAGEEEVRFIRLEPGVELQPEKELLLVDVVEGLDEIRQLSEAEVERISFVRGGSVHNYDVGFQVKLLKKLGKLEKLVVIGIPKD